MMTAQRHWKYRKSLASDLDLGHAAIEELMLALGAASWEGSDLFRIQMAIEEAVVNAIEHGNKRDVSKNIHLDFEVTPEKVVLDITDEGAGFDHRNVADPTDDELVDKPRGRGVMLMRELMSEAIYNDIGNRVVMTKYRSLTSDSQDESSSN